jgi:hypothetical protein
MLCSVPLLLAPLASRSAFETREERAVFVERFPASRIERPTSGSEVKVARDPFASDALRQTVASNTLAASPKAGVVGMHVAQGQPIGISIAGLPVVRAIVSGSSPRALIEEQGRVRIVAAGDILAGSTVVRIAAGGIVLSNGASLKLAEAKR